MSHTIHEQQELRTGRYRGSPPPAAPIIPPPLAELPEPPLLPAWLIALLIALVPLAFFAGYCLKALEAVLPGF